MAKVTKRADKKPNGRPTLYRVEYCRMAFRMCLLGATDAELAIHFGVPESTLNNWKHKHPKFLESIKSGKEEADSKVVESLYARALGYSHNDVDIRTVSVGDGISEIVQTPIIKHYPPDATSLIFWLKNRQGKKWRNSEMELTVKLDVGEQVALELAKQKAKSK
ncbi:MAG TPA: hypothetical protein VK737_07025 [Opitutales bacterium]|jgi:hypothetical protein|nr:hypothetical protein [Opitutales bacterium]